MYFSQRIADHIEAEMLKLLDELRKEKVDETILKKVFLGKIKPENFDFRRTETGNLRIIPRSADNFILTKENKEKKTVPVSDVIKKEIMTSREFEQFQNVVQTIVGTEEQVVADESSNYSWWQQRKDVTIIIDWSKSQSVIFGDFMTTYSTFKSTVLQSNKKFYELKAKLAYGPGWIIKSSDALNHLELNLEKHNISYRKLKKSEVEYEINNKRQNSIYESSKTSSNTSSAESDDDYKSSKITTEEIKEPKKNRKIFVNKWGNKQDEDNFVLSKLPISAKGKMSEICIGLQDKHPKNQEIMGIDTVMPLDKISYKKGIMKGYVCLKVEMMSVIKKYDTKLFEDLTKMTEKNYRNGNTNNDANDLFSNSDDLGSRSK